MGWQGRISDAEKLQREALEIYGRQLGPENPQTLVGTTCLASIILEGGSNYPEAEKLLLDTLPIELRVFGREQRYANYRFVLARTGRC